MTRVLTVEGMSCGHCEASVEEAIESLPGVTSVEADHESDTVTVDGDVDDDELRAAVAEAGYETTS